MSLKCISDYTDGDNCSGEVHEYTSRSGASTSFRCEEHQAVYEAKMDGVYADINSRYPGWDNPHSSPPSWFDASYAGETW